MRRVGQARFFRDGRDDYKGMFAAGSPAGIMNLRVSSNPGAGGGRTCSIRPSPGPLLDLQAETNTEIFATQYCASHLQVTNRMLTARDTNKKGGIDAQVTKSVLRNRMIDHFAAFAGLTRRASNV